MYLLVINYTGMVVKDVECRVDGHFLKSSIFPVDKKDVSDKLIMAISEKYSVPIYICTESEENYIKESVRIIKLPKDLLNENKI
jgi:hypothetical protein